MTGVEQARWDIADRVRVVCVYGDTVSYPSALVELQRNGVLKTGKLGTRYAGQDNA